MSDKDHYIPYGRQWIDDDDIQAVVEVLKSDWLTQGPKIREFEESFAVYCGAKYAVAVSNGTAALHLACLASGLGQGDEVITSPVTFAASANCALYVGAKPVFADISATYNIDPEEIAGNISSRTKAVIPVHFAGLACNMEKIQKIAQKNNLSIIEDACHALGAEYASGGKVGCCKYSDMTVFSFHPVKHITTGEGGMITTNNQELYNKLLMLRTHGITRDVSGQQQPWYYEMRCLGFNYRITDIQSALGISQLKKIDMFIERRRKIADYYNEEFKAMTDYLILPPGSQEKHAWHLYAVQFKNGNRDRLFEKLREKGIGVNVHYVPVYLHPYYRDIGYKTGLCPKAEEYSSRSITLPLYPSMNRGDMKYVVMQMRNALNECSK